MTYTAFAQATVNKEWPRFVIKGKGPRKSRSLNKEWPLFVIKGKGPRKSRAVNKEWPWFVIKGKGPRKSRSVNKDWNWRSNKIKTDIEIIILQCSCSILTLPNELFTCSHWVEFLISWLDWLQNQKDERIGRNILKIDSQSETNNQKHWKAKRVMPFQGRESDLSLHCF